MSGTVVPQGDWRVDWTHVATADRDAFVSAQQLLQQPMDAVTRDRRSAVSRLSMQSVYYVKPFVGRGSHLKFWLGISRYQREVRNLGYFRSLGLDTPQLAKDQLRYRSWRSAQSQSGERKKMHRKSYRYNCRIFN